MDERTILEATVRLVREAGSLSRLPAVADRVARIAAEMAGADQATVGLVREGEIETVAALYPRRLPLGSRFPVGFGVAGWVAATGQAAEIADVRNDRRYVPLPYPEVRSFLAVPLRAGEDLVGVLSLAAWDTDAFPDGAAEAIEPLAEHAAVLLRRTEQTEALLVRLHDAEVLQGGPRIEQLHELKGPLHALTGLVELVASGQAGALERRQKDLLKSAMSEAQRLREAVTGLIEVGAAVEREHVRQPVSPRTLLETAALRARNQASLVKVRVQVRAPLSLPEVRVDAAAILQVLSNLVQNALRVSPAGSTLSLAAEMRSSHSVTFSVEDQGPGLPPGATRRLFERFEQGSATSQTRLPGDVGLGLWVARRLIQAHGGTLWAENRAEGAGARVAFSLPCDTLSGASSRKDSGS